MGQPYPSETFVGDLTGNQRRLYAYILSLLADVQAAEDVLQNTNTVIWQQSGTFVPGTNFMAWACQIAHHQVLGFIRDRGRDRHLFDESLLDELAARGSRREADCGTLSVYLEECLSRRGDDERALLAERYSLGASVKQMAADRDMTPNTLSIVLCRLRRALLECIERKLAREGHA